MTIETLNAIKDEVVTLESSLADLAVKITEAEDNGVVVPAPVDDAYAQMGVSLKVILDWVNEALENGTEEPELTAMQSFLTELKAVFDKYSAVLERLDGAGYGSSYGGADFFRITVTDPVSGDVETKDIVPAVADTITSVDLV